jgi:hypothetical protein
VVELTYITHDSPIGRTDRNHLALVDLVPFGFPDTAEQVWLVQSEGARFTVACVPFRVYGLAYSDTVELDDEGRKVVRVAGRSGHRVFRVFFPPALAEEDMRRVGEAIAVASAGNSLQFEWSGTRHVAIDIPTGGRLDDVWNIVQPLEVQGRAVWEWADAEDFRV